MKINVALGSFVERKYFRTQDGLRLENGAKFASNEEISGVKRRILEKDGFGPEDVKRTRIGGVFEVRVTPGIQIEANGKKIKLGGEVISTIDGLMVNERSRFKRI